MLDDYQNILTIIVSAVTGVGGYLTGRRKQIAEADRTAFEAYNYALESLRKEFEARTEDLQRQIKELQGQRCTVSNCQNRRL